MESTSRRRVHRVISERHTSRDEANPAGRQAHCRGVERLVPSCSRSAGKRTAGFGKTTGVPLVHRSKGVQAGRVLESAVDKLAQR